MSDPDHSSPQEWPAHLGPGAPVSPVRVAPPVGEPLLDFTMMPSATFEQFCWWLLKKDQTLVGCKRLGASGTAQGGIDLFAFDEHQTHKLSVFECKAWKNFDASRLTEAINAFLTGEWASSASKFTIIIAQREIGDTLAKRWQSERQRLKRSGIEGDLWTAHTLTLKAQAYPDLLSKFFPWHSVEYYANQWMQRVAFYELVSKSFFDPRERVARWARELLVDRDTPTNTDLSSQSLAQHDVSSPVAPSTRIKRYGNSWDFKGSWFSLSAILPDQRFTQASAAITFNRPDMQGMTLTVDHKWLLKQFLFREKAPLKSQYRGFITVDSSPGDSQCLVDLPHCRFFLQEEGTCEIAEAADLLTEAVRKSVMALENAWCAVDFPFVKWAGSKVALAAIDARVWSEIGLFAEEHDVANGSSQWHMFDGNRQVLKPFHNTDNEHFDVGYHGVFYAVEIDGLSYKREIVLLWQPNGLQPDQTLSPRGWWSCEFAFEWLRNTLLPEVKRSVYERNFGRRRLKIFRGRRASEFSAYLDELFVLRDLRKPPLIRGEVWSLGIVESVQELQRYFCSVQTPEPYIHLHDVEKLYCAAANLAHGRRGYVGYAASKLGLDEIPVDHVDLTRLINEHISENLIVANSGVVDGVFRAFLELLDGSDDWLSESDRVFLRKSIAPFARLRDDAILVERHTSGPELGS